MLNHPLLLFQRTIRALAPLLKHLQLVVSRIRELWVVTWSGLWISSQKQLGRGQTSSQSDILRSDLHCHSPQIS